MEYTIGTKVKFETAHRQLGDESKCGFLHGHNWKAEITITATKLDKVGYVIDFKKIKDAINNTFDHKTLLNIEDIELTDSLKRLHQKIYEMEEGNPTCELLAAEILYMIIPLLPKGAIKSLTVKLYENEDSFAEVHYP